MDLLVRRLEICDQLKLLGKRRGSSKSLNQKRLRVRSKNKPIDTCFSASHCRELFFPRNESRKKRWRKVNGEKGVAPWFCGSCDRDGIGRGEMSKHKLQGPKAKRGKRRPCVHFVGKRAASSDRLARDNSTGINSFLLSLRTMTHLAGIRPLRKSPRNFHHRLNIQLVYYRMGSRSLREPANKEMSILLLLHVHRKEVQ